MSQPLCLFLSTYFAAYVLSQDVTTIFQLSEGGDGKWLTSPHFSHLISDGQVSQGYENLGSLRVLITNDAQGFPVQKGNTALLHNKWAGQPCCESWSHQGWDKLTDEDAFEQKPPLELDSFTLNDKQNISASIWRLHQETAQLRSPPIPEWFVSGDICIAIAARVGTRASLVVSVEQYQDEEKKSRELATITGPTRPKWLQKRIVIRQDRRVLDGKVQIVLVGRRTKDKNSTLLVQWVAGCNPDGRGDDIVIDKLVPASDWKNQLGFRTIQRQPSPNEFFRPSSKPKSHPVCQNDGLLDMEAKCLCRPGFTGRLCEKGCGPNRVGDNCESRCSSEDFNPRQCRGMMLCTPDLTCDCGPGLKGLQCDQPCEKGKYGIGCRQSCGICSFGETCDPYTGWCTRGCQGALLPPLCKKECGRRSTVAPFIGSGRLADAPQYPWHVGIYRRRYILSGANSREITTDYICGGTLISLNVVVTAGNCVYNSRAKKLSPAEYLSVGLGKQKSGSRATEKFPERVQRRKVHSVLVPANYDGFVNNKGDDISILMLATPVEETEYVVPACFDMVGSFEWELSSGSVGYVAGWRRPKGNESLSEDLREGTFPIISRRECLNIAPGTFRPYVTKDRFCADEKDGAFVSLGDSGGGFVVPQNGAWFLRGIVSVTAPKEKHFATFTNVSYHRNWIVNFLQIASFRNASLDAFFS